MPPQQSQPQPSQPLQPPVSTRSRTWVWFLVLLLIVIVAGITGAYIYHQIELQSAWSQLQQTAQQSVNNSQPVLNIVTGTTTEESSDLATINATAETVPQDSEYYGQPRATINVQGTASIAGVEVVQTDPPYDASQMHSDWWTGSPAIIPVTNGRWTTTLSGVHGGDVLVLVYDPSTHLLLAQGTVTVSITPTGQ